MQLSDRTRKELEGQAKELREQINALNQLEGSEKFKAQTALTNLIEQERSIKLLLGQ